jgi:putative DNA primase/helicase
MPRKGKASDVGKASEAKQSRTEAKGSNSGSQGQAQGAADFLAQLRPGGPWLLVAIAPDTETITAITAQQQTDVTGFVQRWNGKRNLYYMVNPIRQPLDKKPKKTDVAAIEYLLADLDPAKDETPAAAKARYRAQLETMQPAPAAVVDSGNGLNGLWRLATPIPLGAPVPNAKGKLAYSDEDKATIADVEARCKVVMERLGSAAGTQNIDRILRLPATVNLPTKAKRAAGRVPCETALLWFNGATCTLDDFPLKEPPQGDRKGGNAKLPTELLTMLYLPNNGAGNPVGHWPTRSHLFFAFINAALRKGVDENTIVEAALDPAYAGNAIYAHVQESGGEDHVKRQIEHAANEMPEVDDKGRTLINVVDGKLDETWRATQKALVEHNCPVYVRGGRLVQPLWRWEKSSDDRQVLTAQFRSYNLARLQDVTAHRAVQFQTYDGRRRRTIDIDPPQAVITQLLEAGYWPLFPTVVGIINAPTMRGDGSLLTEQGYDRATQLWYKSSGDVVLPPIPERPSKADAKRALAELNGLLTGFPFEVNEGETSDKCVARSVALAGMMTTVLRGALPAAVPIFLVTATEPRTGKTYLVFLTTVLATGHIPPSTAGASEDRPDEIEKRIETAALSGRPILHLNNLPNGMVLDSARLAELSTEGFVTIRKLGRHEEGLCDCRATTAFLNGNNVRVAGDLVLRTLECRLDAKSEEPETRTFAFDPMAAVRKDRGKYLAAIFTIVRAFLAAGAPRPKDMHSVAGFEAWARFVQQPLLWLGMADPWGNITSMRAMDIQSDELLGLHKVLREIFKSGDKFTVAMCKRKAEEMRTSAYGKPEFNWPELRELMTVHGKINEKSFGRLLGRHRGRITDKGWHYKPAGTQHGGMAYMLVGPTAKSTQPPPQGETM